jgi:hypothetical protein
MKILAQKIALLVLIITALLALFVLCPWLDGEPFHNIKTKHALLEHIKGKKILLVGGSGVANGLSAGVIEKNIHGYRAVNMGLNAGLGLRFNINEIMEYIHKGDLIVLSPEYENFEGGYNGSVQILKAVNIAPFTSKYVHSDQYRNLLIHDSVTFIQLKAQSYFDRLTSIFTHASVTIDDRGDRTSESPSRDVGKMEFSLKVTPEAYSECVTILNHFDTFCRERGAIVLLSYPSLPTTQFKASQQDIYSLHNKLSEDTHILILHTPSEMVFSPEYFDDSVYHLSKSGREIRSQKIADMIKTRLMTP